MDEEIIKKTAQYLVDSKYAIALTGAGISTESGIPDFRGPDGLWTKNPEAERQAYEMYFKFQRNPGDYWTQRLTRPYMPVDFSKINPNPGHYALAELEQMGFLKCVLTQNIDGLHERAGSKRILEYHGSVNKLRCSGCAKRFKHNEFDLMAMLDAGILPPICPSCGNPIKDDVVHFNEPIPADVAEGSLEQADKCDLMLICGTSLVVYPFASLPQVARQRNLSKVIIIEVNAEPTGLTGTVSDYIIEGRTDRILPEIVKHVKKLLNLV